MARGRFHDKHWTLDPRMAQLSDAAWALYQAAYDWADVDGRIEGHPARIRGNCVPLRSDWSEERIVSCVEEWVSTRDRDGHVAPLVDWYVGEGGVWVVSFRDFAREQRGLRRDREAPSVLPAPPDDLLSQLPFAAGASFSEANSGLKVKVKVKGEERSFGTPSETGACAPLFPTEDVTQQALAQAAKGGTLSAGVGAGEAGSADEGALTRSPSAHVMPGSSEEDGLAAGVTVVHEHWRRVRGKRHPRYARISANRRKAIQARLREGFTVEELCRAIDAIAIDERRWPDRRHHDDLTKVLRNRECVERFLELWEEEHERASDDRFAKYTRA